MAEDAKKKPKISMWLLIGAGVAAIAILVILRHRASTGANGDTSPDQSSGGFLSGLTGLFNSGSSAPPNSAPAQLVPTGTVASNTDLSGNDLQPLPYPVPQITSNVNNNTNITPQPVPVIPTPAPTPPTTTPQNGSVTVLAGWHFDQWLSDLNKQGYNLTGQDLLKANPDLMSNIAWDPTSKQNYFKTQKQYVVPAADMPQTYAK